VVNKISILNNEIRKIFKHFWIDIQTEDRKLWN